VIHEDLAGEIVLLELATGVYYSLDGVASRIWIFLLAGRTAHEIVTELIHEYDVSREQATGDVDRFFQDLERHGLVEAADA
jgi:hypothetical protein